MYVYTYVCSTFCRFKDVYISLHIVHVQCKTYICFALYIYLESIWIKTKHHMKLNMFARTQLMGWGWWIADCVPNGRHGWPQPALLIWMPPAIICYLQKHMILNSLPKLNSEIPPLLFTVSFDARTFHRYFIEGLRKVFACCKLILGNWCSLWVIMDHLKVLLFFSPNEKQRWLCFARKKTGIGSSTNSTEWILT